MERLTGLIDGLVGADRNVGEMGYAEIVIGFDGNIRKFAGYFHVDFVRFDVLRKCERKRGETAAIGGGGFC